MFYFFLDKKNAVKECCCCLKNAGNDCHFSSDVANFSGNRADPPDDGKHLLLQKSLLLGGGIRKT